MPCINLTRGWLFIRAKSEALDLRGGELVFWFQAHDRYIYKAVNYAFTKHPIEPEALQGEFHNVCMQLTDSLDDWTCMGTNKTDQRLIYGCSPTILGSRRYWPMSSITLASSFGTTNTRMVQFP